MFSFDFYCIWKSFTCSRSGKLVEYFIFKQWVCTRSETLHGQIRCFVQIGLLFSDWRATAKRWTKEKFLRWSTAYHVLDPSLSIYFSVRNVGFSFECVPYYVTCHLNIFRWYVEFIFRSLLSWPCNSLKFHFIFVQSRQQKTRRYKIHIFAIKLQIWACALCILSFRRNYILQIVVTIHVFVLYIDIPTIIFSHVNQNFMYLYCFFRLCLSCIQQKFHIQVFPYFSNLFPLSHNL